jgi:hypothetical protein
VKSRGLVSLAIVLLCSSCDEKSSVATADAAAVTSGTTAPPVSAPPPPASPPIVTVDDTSFVVTGDKVDLTAADAKGRIVALLATKPMISGQTLEVDALRDTTMPHFTTAIEALRGAKAKALTVKTAQRDRTMGTLAVALDHGPVAPCAATAMITKDNAINVWTYGGSIPQRYSHGFAGPDITLGSAAFAKAAAACEAPLAFVAGDDTIKWGVVFDLALAASQTAGYRPTSTVVVKTAILGRKVTD